MPRLPPDDFYDWTATLPADDSTAQSSAERPPLATLAAGSAAPPSALKVSGSEAVGGAVAGEDEPWLTNVGGQEGLDMEAFIDACRQMHGDRARWTSYACASASPARCECSEL